jgi:hypothetical protein
MCSASGSSPCEPRIDPASLASDAIRNGASLMYARRVQPGIGFDAARALIADYVFSCTARATSLRLPHTEEAGQRQAGRGEQ